MLPACVKTEVWRELAESLSAKLKAPVICGPAVFGKLSFFQELRNRRTDDSYADVPGIKYAVVDVDGCKVFVGPFRTDEAHSFDEELADSRHKLPAWKEYYPELIETSIKGAATAGRSAFIVNESLNRAKLLLEFSQAVGHSQDADHALYTAIEFLARRFKLNNVFISAFGKHARHFDLPEAGRAVEQRIVAQVKGNKSIFTIHDVQSDFLLEGIKGRESLHKCVVGFPLTVNRELVGYAVVYAEYVPAVDSIAEVLYELSGVLSRLSHYEKVQESAVTDALTGLSNRAELVKRVDEMISMLSKQNLPISVMMIDVDNFKNFNDTKGHPEGDRILRAVGEIIKSLTPEGGICCRYGGEEFMIVLPVAQRIAKDLAEQVRVDVEKNCTLTVSIGVMSCMNSSASRDTLIREADRALYRAKHLGKNKVVAFFMLDKTLGVIDA